DGRRLDMARLKPEIKPHDGAETGEQEARSDEQQQRERHLADRQACARPARSAARRTAATLLTKLSIEIHPPELERRSHAQQDADDDRQRQNHRDAREIEADLVAARKLIEVERRD